MKELKTREQKRMEQTWKILTKTFTENTDAWKGDPRAKKYMGHVKRTPARIHTSGLGQALAFLKSRGRAEGILAEEHIAGITLAILDRPGVDLLGALRAEDAAFLFMASEEASEVCGWLARYLAGAGLTPDETEEEPGA